MTDKIKLPTSNWNWFELMKTVEFIESLEFDFHGFIGVHIISNSCTIQGTRLNTSPENFHPAYFLEIIRESKFEAVREAVRMFAVDYNEGKLSQIPT